MNQRPGGEGSRTSARPLCHPRRWAAASGLELPARALATRSSRCPIWRLHFRRPTMPPAAGLLADARSRRRAEIRRRLPNPPSSFRRGLTPAATAVRPGAVAARMKELQAGDGGGDGQARPEGEEDARSHSRSPLAPRWPSTMARRWAPRYPVGLRAREVHPRTLAAGCSCRGSSGRFQG